MRLATKLLGQYSWSRSNDCNSSGDLLAFGSLKVDSQVGTISEGKYADIIAVRGDVLRYIDPLQNVGMVIKRGTRYK